MTFTENIHALEAQLHTRDTAIRRLTDENTQLWAVFKTCHGCRHCVPGVMLGCPIQAYIDLSGHCNQYEKEAKP